MTAPLEAVLFDLDGTLIDSIELILSSYRHALAAHGKRVASDAEILSSMGRPLRATLGPFASDELELEEMVRTYRAYNDVHHDALVRPYEGIDGALGALEDRGLQIAVVTSKARTAALRGLDHAGLGERFELVVGADDVERHKPDPAPVRFALARLGVLPEASIYVGDSHHDIAAGRAAGARTAAALWGPLEREALARAGPNVWLEAPNDIGRLA